MLGLRVATAVVLLGVFGTALFLAPASIWTGLCMAVGLAAAWEWGRLAGLRTPANAIYALAIAAAVSGVLAIPQLLMASFALAIAFWLVAAPFWLWKRPPKNTGMVAAAGVTCLVPAVAALATLREQGAWTLLAVMAIVWISDTAAYFTGRRFGRRKLAPAISPGKTWEGFWGAMVVVAIYAAIVAVFAPGVLPPGAMLPSIGAALVLAVLGVEGDLYESQLKRAAGVKDSGTTLPGHGGVLDRIDALLPLLPAAALLFGR